MKDEVILRALHQKDAAVMNRVMDKYARLLWPIADAVLKSAGSEQDVEECVADAFIQLWEHPERFDPARGSLKSYLCILVRSRAIDRYRSLTRHATVSLEDVVLSEEFGVSEFLHKQAIQELRTALNALEEPAREILLRRYYYEQKPRQIALAMNLSVKQVDNILYRTKRLLRTILTEKGVTP